MKTVFYYMAIGLLIAACSSTTKTATQNTDTSQEVVRIANDSLEYEIIIMDIGFETYLNTIAKPMNFYSQEYYENKNRFYVTEWNIRALNPLRYRKDIYENQIDYDFNVDYGIEVNYKLYNYFKFVENKYKQRFF
ncbi:MAG: DUF6146 family protein [Lutibacter sp.]|nr:DUF6146 family protein [Lutibacter sp.]MDP3946835.1 DUF6146 family protein [Lutibacter sp.]